MFIKVFAIISFLILSSNLRSESKPFVHNIKYGNKEVNIYIDPSIKVKPVPGLVLLKADLKINLHELQTSFIRSLTGPLKTSKCGWNISTSNVKLIPPIKASQIAVLRGNIAVRNYTCIPAVKVFGKIITKEKAVQSFPTQNATSKIDIYLKNDINSLSISAKVNAVRLSGAAGKFAKAFGLNGKIKKIVQKEINRYMNDSKLSISFPKKFKAVDPKIIEAKFISIQSGILGADVQVNAAINTSFNQPIVE